MHRPCAGFGLGTGGGVQGERGEEQLELFVRPAAEHHGVLPEVQVDIHEHRAEIRRAK